MVIALFKTKLDLTCNIMIPGTLALDTSMAYETA